MSIQSVFFWKTPPPEAYAVNDIKLDVSRMPSFVSDTYNRTTMAESEERIKMMAIGWHFLDPTTFSQLIVTKLLYVAAPSILSGD